MHFIIWFFFFVGHQFFSLSPEEKVEPGENHEHAKNTAWNQICIRSIGLQIIFFIFWFSKLQELLFSLPY